MTDFKHDRIIEGNLRSPRLRGIWVDVSYAFTQVVTEISGRTDVIVKVTPGGGHGAKACWIRPKATIEISSELLGDVDAKTVNPTDPEDRKRYEVAWCGFIHECAHSIHTLWTQRVKEYEVSREVLQAALMLEESRIEAQHLRRRPQDREYLRAGNKRHVINSHQASPERSTSSWAFSVAGLILSRKDAGVFTDKDVDALNRIVVSMLGYDLVRRLRAVWQEAQRTDDNDAETMLRLGKKWVALNPPSSDSGQSAAGLMTTESGSAPKGDQSFGFGFLAEKITESGVKPGEGKGDKQQGVSSGQERKDSQRVARELKKFEARGHGPGSVPNHGSWGVTDWRDPSDEERAAARKLTRKLLAAMYRERTEMRISSEIPPGRVRMRQAITRDAEKLAGGLPSAEPFSRVEHKSNPMPPLRAGIALDISGSMSKSVRPATKAAWVIARAVSMVPDSRHMFVTFANNQVDPVIFPREVPTKAPVIHVYPSGDEPLSRAVDILDGSLGLSRPGAARLLVVLSDCYITIPGDSKKAYEAAKRLVRSGCRILWVTHYGPDKYKGSGADSRFSPYLNTIPGVHAVHVPAMLLEDNLPGIIIDEMVKVLRET